MEIINKYFPNLTEDQKTKFVQLHELYAHWNAQINVISRKDFDEFYTRHVLHSLAIAKVIQFSPSTRILDIGTGGGFPGIPLAILFPDCEFHLVDSIGKKIKVIKEVANSLHLNNVIASHERAENIHEKFDFVVSRAVTQMPVFMTWLKGKFKREQTNALPNGILYLKGGDLTEEMKTIRNYHTYYQINDYFKEDFFETKKVVYVQW